GCHGAPDFVAEILSPSSRSRDCLLKLIRYREAGVREYWIVDPERETVTVYDFAENKVGSYTFGDKVRVNLFPGLEIDFAGMDLS
ncbi:Uma2 family endonuclease, partial [Enterocloster lavalensis]